MSSSLPAGMWRFYAMRAFAKAIGIGFFFGWVAAKLLGLALGAAGSALSAERCHADHRAGRVCAVEWIQHESGLLTVTVMGMAMVQKP